MASIPTLKRLALTTLLLGVSAGAWAQSSAAALPEAVAESVAMWRADADRHERGDGVQKDPVFAAALYCRAARAGDAESLFQLGWMYAHGRGVERNDAWAAWFFERAAAQGIPQAPNMLRLLGGVAGRFPDCMRPPGPSAAELEARRVAAEAQAAADAAALAAAKSAALLKLAPKAIATLVLKLAPEYRVQPGLALAIMKAESNFDAAALSPKNAMGLMQLIPETAERFNVKDAYDPKQNIRGGLAYLRWLLAYYEGNVHLVAAAYNAGEGTVDKYLGVPPFDETRNYVRRVLDAAGIAAHPFDAKATLPSPRLTQIREARLRDGPPPGP